MTRYYIVRGHTGLVVSNLEPSMDEFVQGPFADHRDAFDRMQEMESKQARIRGTFEALWPIVAVFCVAAAARVMAG